MTAEPMAKPLVTALVVLPTASRLTMIRSGSPWNSPDISAMPAALSRHRAEGVLGHDDAGGGEHAHAGEGDEVERELQVAAAEGQRHADGDGDGDDGVDASSRGRTTVPDRTTVAGPVAGRLGDLLHRRVVRWPVKYSVRRLTTWASTRPMTTAPKHFQPALAWSLPT